MTDYRAFKREMNRQHKRLLQVLDALKNTRQSPSAHKEALSEALHVMSEHAIKHFKFEEAAMEAACYPGLTKHREEHKAFLKKVTKLCVEKTLGEDVPASKVIEYLRHWFDNHHDTEDRSMDEYLRVHLGSEDAQRTS